MKEFDIVFLGGGPGGYEGAIAAAKRGFSTAVVEKNELGGTCLQCGCIPTKNLLHLVKNIKSIQNSKKLGILIDNYELNLDRIIKNKKAVINKLTRGIDFLFKQNKIVLFHGRGKIIDSNTVIINNQESIQTKNIVIATGSIPAELPFLKFDNKFVFSSTEALELTNIPKKLLVIGAGAIGLEIGLIYKYLGSQVTIVEVMDQILPGSDKELAEILAGELKKQKVKIKTSTSISKPVEKPDLNQIEFKFETADIDPFFESFDQVLLSVGRKPLSANLWEPSVGINTDQRGFILANKNLQTDIPSIFACGDVVGNPLLAHKASHQAINIVDFISEGKPVNHQPIPAAIFTFPEFASVGMTEEEVKDSNLNYTIGRFPYSAGSRSNAIGAKSGLVKVIANRDGFIIGAHIVGEDAGELLQTLNLAINTKVKINQFKELITIHPTLSENVFEAIGEIGGFSIHI
jgi:dihydrolipoamide dehydrogenase